MSPPPPTNDPIGMGGGKGSVIVLTNAGGKPAAKLEKLDSIVLGHWSLEVLATAERLVLKYRNDGSWQEEAGMEPPVLLRQAFSSVP